MLHGDVSSGGPASYHFPFAQRIATENPGVAVAALVRPGYPDGAGNTSVGNNFNRIDQYTAENMDIMAGAIRALKRETGASRVIAIGHSGGAATVANILARDPGLIDAAGLLACNCNIAAWRQGRQPWVRSIDPYRLADQVPMTARVIGMTGANDVNAFPSQKKSYIDRLAARGIAADFVIVPGAGHNSIDDMWRAGLSAWVGPEVARPSGPPPRTT
jgi:pimeloyl-ACP methyl ester carboxylesterase